VTTPQGRRTRRRAGLAGAAVVVLAGLAWWLTSMVPGDGLRMERLAVLPLDDLTDDPEQAFLVAGVHEALIAELGQLGLSVTARRTTSQYQDTESSIAEIAAELDVDGVIAGSVFRAGDSLEIATRLYDRDERELWAGTFDGVLTNVVTLYRGFARAIADRIQLSLLPEEEDHLASATSVNPDVYEAYLRGMQILNDATTNILLGTPGDPMVEFREAIGYFEQAVERNPADPLAHAGLALAWATIGHSPNPPPEAWPSARSAAERAIRLDSTLAEGWAALADYRTYAGHDWEGAEQAFRRANELNPSLAMNHYHYAWYLALFGRVEEAVREHTLAKDLDPLTPLHTVWLPGLHIFSRDYERALNEARLLTEQYPDNAIIWYVVAASALELGLFDEAVAANERAAALDPSWTPYLAQTYAVAGRTEEAQAILRQLESLPPMSGVALGLSFIHAALGNREETLRWLDYEPPHAWVAWFLSVPVMEPYREDPRFQALARRFNLEIGPGDVVPTPLPMVPADSVPGEEAASGDAS
jgi:TolB-like protein/Flp pilus assembly protein TadD